MSQWRLAALALVLLSAHLALGYSHNFLVGADDDRLWLYGSGARVGKEEAGRAVDDRVRRAVIEAGATVGRLTRIDLRAAYYRNYFAATRLYAGAAHVVRRATGDLWQRDYPAYLARAMYAGFVATYVAACVALLAAVAATRDVRWVVAVTLGIATIALLETLFDLAGDTWSGLPTLLPDAQTDEGYWENFWPNVPALFLNPQIQLSPFGDTPRNHFNLVAIGVFVLRWRRMFTASYALLAAFGFLHQSHTALLFASLLAADAVLRPRLFRTRTVVLMAAVAVTFVSRESLGSIVGVTRPVVIAAIVAAALALAVAVYLGLASRVVMPARVWLDRRRESLLRHGDVTADLIVIGTIWVATFPLVAIINAAGTEQHSLYFWTQIHGRWFGVLRPAFIVGLAYVGLKAIAKRKGERAASMAALAVSALALVPSAYLATRHDRAPIARIERQARELDRAIGNTVDWQKLGAASEREIYYAQARTLDWTPGSR